MGKKKKRGNPSSYLLSDEQKKKGKRNRVETIYTKKET